MQNHALMEMESWGQTLLHMIPLGKGEVKGGAERGEGGGVVGVLDILSSEDKPSPGDSPLTTAVAIRTPRQRKRGDRFMYARN